MNRREDIRNFLRMQDEGRSTGEIAEAIGCTNDQARDALKNMRQPGGVCKDDLGKWYWDGGRGLVPEGVAVRREPKAKTVSKPLSVEPREFVELAEHLDRVAVISSEELEKPAPSPEPEVTIKLRVPLSVARRMLLMV